MNNIIDVMRFGLHQSQCEQVSCEDQPKQSWISSRQNQIYIKNGKDDVGATLCVILGDEKVFPKIIGM